MCSDGMHESMSWSARSRLLVHGHLNNVEELALWVSTDASMAAKGLPAYMQESS